MAGIGIAVAVIGLVPMAQSVGAPTNLLLITLDTVRADRIGAYGATRARTPHLDALARAGVRFADATTQSPITGPAHAALLTGVYPARLGVRDNASTPLPAEAVTLAEILGARGYATGAFVGAFILDRPYGFAQGFASFEGGFARVDSGREAEVQRRGNLVVDDALKWMSAVPPGRPFFAWVHLYDAHTPYAPPAPLDKEFAGRPYDGEVAFVDQQVGRLIEFLRSRNRLDRTVVVAVADHGEGLGDHGEDEHGLFLYDEVLRVPWIMAGPGMTPGLVVAEQVRTIDVMPTVAEALRVRIGHTVDGESVMPVVGGVSRREVPPSYSETYYARLHFGWSELKALRADGWKAIDAPRPELYDLRKDPGERQSLVTARQPLAARMIAEAGRMAAAFGGGTAAAVKQPDPETLDRLRSLGYVGIAADLPAGRRGADPKDKVAQLSQYRALMSNALDDIRAQRPEAAIPKLKRLVAINERAYDLHLLLGDAYRQQRQFDQALGEFTAAEVLNPESAAPLVAAAEVHLTRSDVAGARRQVDRARRLEPNSGDVAQMHARVLEREERPVEAFAAYEQAIELNPANPRSRALLASLATRMERYDVAESQLQRLMAIDYQPSRTRFGLGRVAEARGQLDEAAGHYREALRLEPGLQMARDALARIGRQ